MIMVTKKKNAAREKVKIGKLKINKETVKNLTSKEVKKIKGGAGDLRGSTRPGIQTCLGQ
jgi:hypothetical protein